MAARGALVGTMRALSAVPVATGLLGAIGGTRANPDGGPATPGVDSEYRFASLFWAAAGGILWWAAERPVERAAVGQGVLGLAAAGGLVRLESWRREGRPHPIFVGATVLELAVVPAVMAWYQREVTEAR